AARDRQDRARRETPRRSARSSAPCAACAVARWRDARDACPPCGPCATGDPRLGGSTRGLTLRPPTLLLDPQPKGEDQRGVARRANGGLGTAPCVRSCRLGMPTDPPNRPGALVLAARQHLLDEDVPIARRRQLARKPSDLVLKRG